MGEGVYLPCAERTPPCPPSRGGSGGYGLRRMAYLQELIILMPVIMCFAYFWCASVQTGRVNKRMTANMSKGRSCCLWALEIPVCTSGGFAWVYVCVCECVQGWGGMEGWHLTHMNVRAQVMVGARIRSFIFKLLLLLLVLTCPSQNLPLDPKMGGDGREWVCAWGTFIVSTLSLPFSLFFFKRV